MYKRGEIVLIPVPFSNLSSVKKRPVLIISNASHNRINSDMIVVAITSNLQQKGIVIETKDLVAGELPRTSLIRCDKIYTLEQAIVIKQFGIVSENILKKVINDINKLITE
ncbi:type II toxin-antitoxin system PemK/MazF family toxin [Treponema sp. OttesenSCG-928-L16]|nr:type II toxin-antitoxin system PemK/MazF family toxin [Treponema sp. OttesenSCG-928-L16]